jgi:hypothetical protein
MMSDELASAASANVNAGLPAPQPIFVVFQSGGSGSPA